MTTNLSDNNLRRRLEGCSLSEFPQNSDYRKRFENLDSFLNEQVHPSVTISASTTDRNLLTDHGPDHIRTVIARASDLLANSPTNNLTCYEIYLLLSAIHVHDVGNALGRDVHELSAEEVMKWCGPVFGPDEVEKRTIFSIAQAHGGTTRHGKDKISELKPEDHVLGQRVRFRVLAALLRLADELADDRSRSSRFLLEATKIPEKSLIYHKYAHALHSVTILPDSINLKFEVPEKDAMKLFIKGSKRILLLEEIYARTLKMHWERLYCMRFLRSLISIDRIDVAIEVFGERYTEEAVTIAYRLAETGYPDDSAKIFELCPELRRHTCGSPLTGPALKRYILRRAKKREKKSKRR